MGRPKDLPEREVTPRELYLQRREFLRFGALGAIGIAGGSLLLPRDARAAAKLAVAKRSDRAGGETPTPQKDVTTYNNFYEFGSSKEDPARHAGSLRTRPWAIAFEGEIAKPQTIGIDDLLKWFPLEERIYRMRCVEAWSMVIPWVGFPLGDLLKRLEPTSRAKYVAFQTLHDPAQMPGQKTSILAWPYIEGLRIDEAMHPLTLMAVGLYGEVLPNQNGAPIRLVVPWKYGFKSCKSIVRIRLLEKEPPTSWNRMAPSEYGFYANVNPEVDHPRWSQAKERRIGDFFKRKTLPFNGYATEVASMYSGLDLRKHY